MFSNLGQNSVLYVFDPHSEQKVLSGPVERVSVPRPKYTTLNPSMEMVVDITAVINGERREFKGVPNNSVADFGTDSFILAENKESLGSYINAMLQNSKAIINSVSKHERLISVYEEALQELDPAAKAGREKDKAIHELQEQVESMKQMMKQLLTTVNKDETPKQV